MHTKVPNDDVDDDDDDDDDGDNNDDGDDDDDDGESSDLVGGLLTVIGMVMTWPRTIGEV